MLAVVIAWGAALLILWCMVQEQFLVIPVTPPHSLSTVRILACFAFQIIIVHARVAVVHCSCFAKHISKNCVHFLFWYRHFDKARSSVASADRLLYCSVCKQNFP
jgi:hypothetical protein